MSSQSPASPPAGGAPSYPTPPVVPSRAALAEVLTGLLAPPSAGGPTTGPASRSQSGVTAALDVLTPALAALHALRGELDGWDGTVHRRCCVEPAAAAAARRVAPATWSDTRGGWQTLVDRRVLGTCTVAHWLARRMPAGTVHRPSTRVPDDGCPPARLPDDDAAGGWDLCLTTEQVAVWARASGDGNSLHLRPGEGARAGLGTAPDEVVVHGLLLGALSLALVPAAPAPVADLRFVAPAAVGPAGLDLHVTTAGDVHDAVSGRTLLRRG